MASCYSEVKEIPKMTQEDLTHLYDSEGIYKTDIDSLRKEVKKKIAYIDKMLKNKELSNSSKEELVEMRKNSEKQLEKIGYSKCYRFVSSSGMIVRKYPSQELINTVVEAHLYLAEKISRFYSRIEDCERKKPSFDDLFQCASETLIHAARQYVPGDRATFVTYARKCIENRLIREIYGEKKKKTVKMDGLTLEFERMLLARKLLINLSRNNIFLPKQDKHKDDENDFFTALIQSEIKKRNSYSSFFRTCNLDIKKFNRKMSGCCLPTISFIGEEHPIKDFMAIYSMLVSNSFIDQVVTEEDMWVVRLSMHYKTDSTNKRILEEVNRIDFYLRKLVAIKELMDFEKDYMKNHAVLRPSEEEMLAFLQRRAREASVINKKAKYKEPKFIKSLQTYDLESLSCYILKRDDEEAQNKAALDFVHFYRFLGPKIVEGDFKSIYRSFIKIQSLEALANGKRDGSKDPKLSVEDQAINSETTRVFREALEDLPEEERKVLELMISPDGLNQHKPKEVAELFGMTSKSVSSLRDKGLRKLRKNEKLKDYLEEPED